MAEESFGDRLRARRLELGLTQEQVARRTDLTMMSVSRLERSKDASPRLDTIKELAAALDVDPAWLAWGEDAKKAAA